MADDTNTAERDAFEAWCVTQGWVEKPSARPNGTYVNGSLQARWLGWIGRASLAASAGSEPVAWRDPSNMCDDQSFTLSRERAKKWPHIYKQPLYTHPSPPDGMAMVPTELTPEMKRAAMDLLLDGLDIYVNAYDQVEIQTTAPARLWAAMIAAAPPLPASEAKEL